MKLTTIITAAFLASFALAATVPVWAQSAPTAEDFLMDPGSMDFVPDQPPAPFLAMGEDLAPLPFDMEAPPPLEGNVFELAEGAPDEGPPLVAVHPHGGPGAGSPDGHGPGFGPRPGCGGFPGLNLSDDQYEQLFAVKKASVGKMAPKIGELMAAHVDLRDQMLKPDIDKAKIASIQNRINALHADIANQRLEDRVAMMSVLTPDQRKELRTQMLKRMAMPGFGGGRGGHHRFGGACGKH